MKAGGSEKKIGSSADLIENGPAILFRVLKDGKILPAFVVRAKNQVRAYLNICPHAGLRLNNDSNVLFHREADYLFCTAHGAGFDPHSGACITGPSSGLSLMSLGVRETDGEVFLTDCEYELNA